MMMPWWAAGLPWFCVWLAFFVFRSRIGKLVCWVIGDVTASLLLILILMGANAKWGDPADVLRGTWVQCREPPSACSADEARRWRSDYEHDGPRYSFTFEGNQLAWRDRGEEHSYRVSRASPAHNSMTLTANGVDLTAFYELHGDRMLLEVEIAGTRKAENDYVEIRTQKYYLERAASR
jgi:hypothetical protein